MKDSDNLPRMRSENLVVKELADEVIIYDLTTNKAFCLNAAARRIMEFCDGKTSLDQARRAIEAETDRELSPELIRVAVEDFRRFDLLADRYDRSFISPGIKRREALRAAAVLGIAIPVVSGLIAPSSAHALSCIGQNQTCTGSNDTRCCLGLVCINIEQGPTGFVCFGCIGAGQPCTLGGTPCCNGGFCAPINGIPVCQVIG